MMALAAKEQSIHVNDVRASKEPNSARAATPQTKAQKSRKDQETKRLIVEETNTMEEEEVRSP
jgi:hypothetical protein